MNATATVSGKRCEVVITSDLGDNFAVEVMPPPETVKKGLGSQRPAPLFIYKLKADNWQAAAWAVLNSLKEQGQIQDFQSEPPPAKESKVAAAAAADEGEE